MNKYKEARNKGGDYLLKQLHDDGSFGGQCPPCLWKSPAVERGRSRIVFRRRNHRRGIFGPPCVFRDTIPASETQLPH